MLEGVHPSNIHRLPLYPLFRDLYPSQRMFMVCAPFEYSLHALSPLLKGCTPLAMDTGGVYTLAIFIACPYTLYEGVCIPCDEYLRGVHPRNIHGLPLYARLRGVYPSP